MFPDLHSIVPLSPSRRKRKCLARRDPRRAPSSLTIKVRRSGRPTGQPAVPGLQNVSGLLQVVVGYGLDVGAGGRPAILGVTVEDPHRLDEGEFGLHLSAKAFIQSAGRDVVG